MGTRGVSLGSTYLRKQGDYLMSLITKEQLRSSLPTNLRGSISDELVEMINNVGDPIIADQIRDNFVSFSSVLNEGKFKILDYLNAVKYVSYKLMGNTNRDAYVKTFPERYNRFVANGVSNKDIASYVASYNNGKLVNMVREQSMVPMWVLNQDKFQLAVNTCAQLMMDENINPRERVAAAGHLMTHLQKPKEAANVALNVNIAESSGMQEMKDTITELARYQRDMIMKGVPTKDIAEQRLVTDVEFNDD